MNNEQNYALANTENDGFDLTVDGEVDYVADLMTRSTSYCSIVAETNEDKAKIYNAMNNPDKRLKDCINEVIALTDVYVETVECTSETTGETIACPRVVLIDEDGIGYQAVSKGIFSALKKLFAIYGEPTKWDEPINVKVRQISNGTRNILTLDVVA